MYQLKRLKKLCIKFLSDKNMFEKIIIIDGELPKWDFPCEIWASSNLTVKGFLSHVLPC